MRWNCFSSCPAGQMYRSFSASQVKSEREKVPSVRFDLSKTGVQRAYLETHTPQAVHVLHNGGG
jgi:hypothetical protein